MTEFCFKLFITAGAKMNVTFKILNEATRETSGDAENLQCIC